MKRQEVANREPSLSATDDDGIHVSGHEMPS